MFLTGSIFMLILSVSAEYFNHIGIRILQNGRPIELLDAVEIKEYPQADEILIEDQNVTRLIKGSFKDLLKLRNIKIQYCPLQEIEREAFQNLPRLTLLNLNFNQLKTLRDGIFYHLNITTLYLIGNGIEELNRNVFHHLHNLQTLDLSRNNIAILHENMFVGTPDMRVLNLAYNQLEKIPDDFFDGAFDNVYAHQDSLIDLSHNNITYMSAKSLSGIRNIHTLRLKDNKIEQISHQLLDGIDYINVLDLESNLLRSLDRAVLQHLTNAEEILLSANNWDCHFVYTYGNWCLIHSQTNTIDFETIESCN